MRGHAEADALIQTGDAKKSQGDLEGALAAYRRARALAPENPAAHNAYALALKAAGRTEDAVDCLRKAAETFPAFPHFPYNMGNALADAGRPEDAAAAYERAVAVDPGHFKARTNLALAWLALGRLREGFADYEHRFKAPGFPPPVCAPAGPAWDGGDLSGKRILLIAEQGLGDTLHFVRYARAVKARGAAAVIAACPATLAELLQGQPGVDEILPRTAPGAPIDTAFDAHICLMSLPRVFETTLETIPADIPYLYAPADFAARAADWGVSGPGFKAGFVWRAGHMGPTGARRSLPPEALPALLAAPLNNNTPGVRWFGLDAPAPGDPRPDADLGAEITDLSPHIRPFTDTAAAVAAMDVIVTVDTAMAHLAGALGKRVFVLLPYAPDWRWGLKGGTAPWYPNARLFRQHAPGDWSAPIAACRTALAKAAAEAA